MTRCSAAAELSTGRGGVVVVAEAVVVLAAALLLTPAVTADPPLPPDSSSSRDSFLMVSPAGTVGSLSELLHNLSNLNLAGILLSLEALEWLKGRNMNTCIIKCKRDKSEDNFSRAFSLYHCQLLKILRLAKKGNIFVIVMVQNNAGFFFTTFSGTSYQSSFRNIESCQNFLELEQNFPKLNQPTNFK